jgi:hypothetical protein
MWPSGHLRRRNDIEPASVANDEAVKQFGVEPIGVAKQFVEVVLRVFEAKVQGNMAELRTMVDQ